MLTPREKSDTKFKVTGMSQTGKRSMVKAGVKPTSVALQPDVLPLGQRGGCKPMRLVTEPDWIGYIGLDTPLG